ncbi:hypothetical protein [Mitsuaria sp. GD03876]|uniref:hypothetical protein n=1 Tax=Mitsuaria sp. GD03876 TaxID=2975399 RepID=UPI0024491E38|nr:hypothetical protein [Mitsuaria sp. GD03876]MDH0865156.1 hypothetical protein [Mitsuaria sp. GD03876]
MTPPDASGSIDGPLTTSIRQWCEDGAFPVMTEPLKVASTAPNPGLDGAAADLDGSHELARLGRWPGLLWRLQLLLRECVSEHVRPQDPWDCGWWRVGSPDAAAGFRPRRATLLLVREVDMGALNTLLDALRTKSAIYEKPVRVLVISEAAQVGMERL